MFVVLRRFVVLCSALLVVVSCTSSRPHATTSPATPTVSPATASPATASPATTSPATTTPTHTPSPTKPASATSPAPAGLPLPYPTGAATRAITVVAASTSSTTATLQAWQKTERGWERHGVPTKAYLGSAGLSAHPSESLSATPIGSFTLTQAFGRQPDPGTALPYRQTTPADWWISQPGSLYNTLQHCASGCAFTQDDPNEHLYYTTPFYEYAVVIDYNRSPVVQGAGSAFFVHVSVGEPTQGCVSIPQAALVSLLRWLTPAAHPRILIGVG